MCYSALVERNLNALKKGYGVIAVRTDLHEFEERVFPHHDAPVIHEQDGERTLDLMRYSVYPPAFVSDPRKYGSVFNARRDNLTSAFWQDAFMRHHGFIVIKAFYEWVAVADLLKAGVVTLDTVKAEFDRQIAERKAKVEASGKRYKPTPTELKDPRFRQIIIEFKPETERGGLIVPVVFSEKPLEDGAIARGFAIVTDDPPPEISLAGHDRCPVFLQPAFLDAWLHPERSKAEDMLELLGRQQRIVFKHSLPEVA